MCDFKKVALASAVSGVVLGIAGFVYNKVRKMENIKVAGFDDLDDFDENEHGSDFFSRSGDNCFEDNLDNFDSFATENNSFVASGDVFGGNVPSNDMKSFEDALTHLNATLDKLTDVLVNVFDKDAYYEASDDTDCDTDSFDD